MNNQIFRVVGQDSNFSSVKLQGKAKKTIDAYSRAVRRTRDYFGCCPDQLKPEDLERYALFLKNVKKILVF